MALKPFFPDAEDPYFDRAGLPKRPGQYEFLRSDGRRIVYSLAYETLEPAPSLEDAGDGEGAGTPRPEPRLRVVRASRMEDFPQPPHALRRLDGEWLRFLSAATPEDASEPMEPSGSGTE